MVQSLWKTVCRFLRKLELPYDPAILPLGVHPDKTMVQKYTCSLTLTALSTIARTWKQLIGPSNSEWRKKIWCIYIYN